MAMIFYAIMDSDSKLPSEDNTPNFFSNDDKNTGKSLNKKNNEMNLSKPSPEMSQRRTNLTVHWPSLGIGAGVAIACIFCGVLLVNMIDTEPTQILDEITISEITATEKPTIASFYGNASPILGDINAPLTLIEFGDYQCTCLLYTSPSPRDLSTSRMPSSA